MDVTVVTMEICVTKVSLYLFSYIKPRKGLSNQKIEKNIIFNRKLFCVQQESNSEHYVLEYFSGTGEVCRRLILKFRSSNTAGYNIIFSRIILFSSWLLLFLEYYFVLYKIQSHSVILLVNIFKMRYYTTTFVNLLISFKKGHFCHFRELDVILTKRQFFICTYWCEMKT